jgi:mycinamicin biosynthesis methyltransferase MycE-like protein
MSLTVASGRPGTCSAAESTEVIRRLLAATASHDADLAGTIDEVGAARTARVLIDELLFRACLDDLARRPGEHAAVVIVLTHGGQAFTETVSVGPDGVAVGMTSPVPAGRLPAPVLTQDLAEVAAALYGPVELVGVATRTVHWPGPEVVLPTAERPSLPTVFYAVVQRIVAVLDRQEPADLAELAVRYGTDKWGAMHQYPSYYQQHFGPLRQHRLRVLEIGIGGTGDPSLGGASLRVWKRYFPRALVYGVDILDKHLLDAPRLTTVLADQSDATQMASVAHRYGPFDIVIDDGSHISRHVITSFRTLFPHLRRNGLYVIEDLQAAYWPGRFEGSDRNLNDPGHTVGFLKTLLDGLHHQDFLSDDAREPQPTDTQINAVCVYRNLAVMQKGPNTEASPVASVLRAARSSQPPAT